MVQIGPQLGLMGFHARDTILSTNRNTSGTKVPGLRTSALSLVPDELVVGFADVCFIVVGRK